MDDSVLKHNNKYEIMFCFLFFIILFDNYKVGCTSRLALLNPPGAREGSRALLHASRTQFGLTLNLFFFFDQPST